ncbi:MAG: Gfo/Idh/MocA family oxidoreductase, partial [Kiritimatiellae bacterium]|nr:Gfo/Idh/MocA family oxidoreductase [Kiritimatiellia bacterium]
MNRRSFLKSFAVSAAFASGGCRNFFIGKPAKVVPPGQKVRLGIIGSGGKGMYDWTHLYAAGAEIVAFCDVDSSMIDSSLAKFQELGGNTSKVRRYSDWRKMLECEERNIDAVTVSTPDHMHAAIAVTAMKLGLHCYVQKPLVRTLWENKMFGEVARETGVITQMGNQGSSGSGHRRN